MEMVNNDSGRPHIVPVGIMKNLSFIFANSMHTVLWIVSDASMKASLMHRQDALVEAKPVEYAGEYNPTRRVQNLRRK